MLPDYMFNAKGQLDPIGNPIVTWIAQAIGWTNWDVALVLTILTLVAFIAAMIGIIEWENRLRPRIFQLKEWYLLPIWVPVIVVKIALMPFILLLGVWVIYSVAQTARDWWQR